MTAAMLWAALIAGQLVDGHLHAAPHGGVIAHAGALHLETVVEETGMEVWLLDRRGKPLPSTGHTLAATLRFQSPDRPAQTVTFAPSGDHFRALVDLAGLPALNVELRLDAGKRTTRAAFRWTLLDARHRLGDGDPLEGVRM